MIPLRHSGRSIKASHEGRLATCGTPNTTPCFLYLRDELVIAERLPPRDQVLLFRQSLNLNARRMSVYMRCTVAPRLTLFLVVSKTSGEVNSLPHVEGNPTCGG